MTAKIASVSSIGSTIFGPSPAGAHRNSGPFPARGRPAFAATSYCGYLVLGEAGSDPDWVPVLPAPAPPPTPPAPGTAPELPMLVLEPVPEDEDAPPALEPLLGLPVVMPSSFRHFSRSLPVMPRHLLLELVLGELVLGELLLGELLLGELLLGELASGELLPVEPVALL